MTKRRFNFAKAVWLIVLCIGIVFFGAANALALIIPIDVKGIRAEGPSAGTDYLTQYWLNTAEFGELDAFCVENENAFPVGDYELVDLPSSLSRVAEYASRYYDGSVLALGFASQLEAKVATQLAIWQELGIAETTNATWANRVAQVLGINNLSISDSIYLAQSPTGQDYLVSVPDASIMFLLGSGLLGLGLFGRRRKAEF